MDILKFGRSPVDILKFGRSPVDILKFGRSPVDILKCRSNENDQLLVILVPRKEGHCNAALLLQVVYIRLE